MLENERDGPSADTLPPGANPNSESDGWAGRDADSSMTNLKPDWRALFDSEVAARYELDRLAHDGEPSGKKIRFCGSQLKIFSPLTVSLLRRMSDPNHRLPNWHHCCQHSLDT